MKIQLLSCDAQRPDKRAIAKCIAEIALNVNDSLAREFTEILLENDSVNIEIADKKHCICLKKP